MREPRVVATFNVAYERLGKRVVVQSEDVSRRGLFLRTIDFLPVGDVLELEIKVGGGDLAVTVVSRVAHVLSEPAARSLGREPGMGHGAEAHGGDQRACHGGGGIREVGGDQCAVGSAA